MKFFNIIKISLYFIFPCYFIYMYLLARKMIPPVDIYAVIKLILISVGFISMSRIKQRNGAYGFMVFFIIYTVLSGLLYLFIDRPLSCYTDALSNFILPMLMFFVGMDSTVNHNKFVRNFSIGFAVALLLTIPPYITLSPWYYDYIYNSWFEGSQSVGFEYRLDYLRFGAVFTDSYYVMYLSFSILAYFLQDVIINKSRDWVSYIVICLCIISLILCQQRTALLMTALSIPYFLIFRSGKIKALVPFLFLFFVVAIGVTMFQSVRMGDLTSLISDRVDNMAFSTAFGEREDKVTKVFNIWQNPVFGDGVGVYSHEAYRLGKTSVNDCAWIKLLVENGVVGLSLFILFIICTLIHAVKRIKYYYSEVLIIMFFMVAMIGSDSLSMITLLSLFFWFAIGRIWNSHPSTTNVAILKNEKFSIFAGTTR